MQHGFYRIEQEGLKANVYMNPHDHMVSCFVEEVGSQELLDQLAEFLKTQNGGKIMVHLPADCPFRYPSDFAHPHAVYMKVTDLLARENLQQYSADRLQPYHIALLFPHEDAVDEAALFDFKCKHADFVTEDKVKNDIYSSLAEGRKVNQPNVLHFALLDKDANLVATTMVTIDQDWAYVSDIIVHRDLRQQHIATALLENILSRVHAFYPELNYVWVIAGGDGQKEMGTALKKHFGAKPLDKVAYQSLNVALVFADARPLLHQAKGQPIKLDSDCEAFIQSMEPSFIEAMKAKKGACINQFYVLPKESWIWEAEAMLYRSRSRSESKEDPEVAGFLAGVTFDNRYPHWSQANVPLSGENVTDTARPKSI